MSQDLLNRVRILTLAAFTLNAVLSPSAWAELTAQDPTVMDAETQPGQNDAALAEMEQQNTLAEIPPPPPPVIFYVPETTQTDPPLNDIAPNESVTPPPVSMMPAYLQTVEDTTYGGSITRVTGTNGTAAGSTGATWGARNVNRYSTDSSFNSDGRYLIVDIMESNHNAKLLLNGDTYQPIRALSIPNGSGGTGFTNYRWSTNPNNPNVVYVFFEGTNKVYAHNVATNTTRTITTTFNVLSSGKDTVSYDAATGKEYITLLSSTSTGGVYAYVVDLGTGVTSPVVASLKVADDFCVGACDGTGGDRMSSSGSVVIDGQSTMMSDDGKFIRIVMKNSDNSSPTERILKVTTNADGTKSLSVHISSIPYMGHASFVTKSNGDQVLVGLNGTTPVYVNVTAGSSSRTSLSDGSSGAAHVSGTSSLLPGWVIVTYADSGSYRNEIVAFNIDTGAIIRLVNHQSSNQSTSATVTGAMAYRSQPKANISQDGTKIIFQSNLGQGTSATAQISTFVVDVDLPGSRPGNFIPPTSAPVTNDPDQYTLQYTIGNIVYSLSGTALRGKIKGPAAGQWSEGPNTIEFTQTVSGQSRTFVTEVRVDRTPPAVTISPNFYTNSLTATNVGIIFTADGKSYTLSATDVANLVANRGGSLAVDNNDVELQVVDAAGNRTTVRTNIVLDQTPPAIQVTTSALATRSPSTFTVSYTVVDAASGSQNRSLSGTALTNSVIGPVSGNWTEGINQVRVRGTDLAGNIGETIVDVLVDRIGPAIEGPSEPLLTNNINTMVINYTVDGVVRTLSGGTAIRAAIVYPSAGTLTANTSSTPNGVVNKVRVSASDALGNVTTLDIPFTYDVVAPVIAYETVTSAKDPYLTNNLDTFVFKYKVGGVSQTLSGQALQDSIVSTTVMSGYVIKKVRFDVFDAAGNKSTVLKDVKLDTTPPRITLTSPVVPASGVINFTSSSVSYIKFTFSISSLNPSSTSSFSKTISGQDAIKYVTGPVRNTVSRSPAVNTLVFWIDDMAGNRQTFTVNFTSSYAFTGTKAFCDENQTTPCL